LLAAGRDASRFFGPKSTLTRENAAHTWHDTVMSAVDIAQLR
jgi:hypothetical protein